MSLEQEIEQSVFRAVSPLVKQIEQMREMVAALIAREESERQVKAARYNAPKCRDSPRTTNVYFMQPVSGGLVKIGAAGNVEQRLKQHQCGSADLLAIVKVIESVPILFEKELHEQFSEYRQHGEWFLPEVLELPIDLGDVCQ